MCKTEGSNYLAVVCLSMWLLCDDPGARTAAGLVLHAVEVGGPLERFLAILK